MATPKHRSPALSDRFRSLAEAVSCGFGSPWALATAIAVVAVWAISGPYFHYSDAWQLVINTGTTIVTFLMAFLIQATQYRASRAVNLKIDELIRAVSGARDGFVNLENLSDGEIDRLSKEIAALGKGKITPLKIASAVANASAHQVPQPQPSRSRKRRASSHRT
jgi:low affinity Fe/Cu permease